MPAFKKVNPNGRPPSLNEELIEKICNVLRAGAYIETAVVVCGVPKAVFYDWCKRAYGKDRKRKRNIYSKLLDAVERAMEESTARDLMNIDKAAMGADAEYMRDKNGGIVFSENGKPIVLKPGMRPDWSASAWRLERRKPKEWGKVEYNPETDPTKSREDKNEITIRFVKADGTKPT